jgi:hypothetical protein
MHTPLTMMPALDRTPLQRTLRARLSRMPFADAVRRAAWVLFRFRYRAVRGCSLWCDVERVWMGSETFLYWAFCDRQIDIPWVVAAALDAPRDADDLQRAVRAELTAYWARKLHSLPCTAKPNWMSLP